MAILAILGLRRKTVACGFLLMLLICTFQPGIISCRKPKETKALIIVLTAGKTPVKQASVELHARDNRTRPGDVSYKGKTDDYGHAWFEFDKEAMLTVNASKDSLAGTSWLLTVKGETVYDTVTVYPRP
jgi:hypothetical protein